MASSYKDSNHSAVYGDLFNTTSIWCPQSNSTIEWLEVDLGAPYFICGVAAVNDVGVTNRTAITWYGVAMSLKVITEDTNGKNVSQVQTILCLVATTTQQEFDSGGTPLETLSPVTEMGNRLLY